MTTPLGIVLRIGQQWREVDKRFTRIVEVTGWDVNSNKVELNKRTHAKLGRFNGKNTGYEPHKL